MSKHTPGPWKFVPEDGVIEAEGELIAATFPKKREANARLIAAAPDLLALLKESLSAFDCTQGAVTERYATDHWSRKARLVIAKIESKAAQAWLKEVVKE